MDNYDTLEHQTQAEIFCQEKILAKNRPLVYLSNTLEGNPHDRQ